MFINPYRIIKYDETKPLLFHGIIQVKQCHEDTYIPDRFLQFEAKKHSVYMHTNKINNKKYIGITGREPEIRWKTGYKSNLHFQRAIDKIGWNNFDHDIIIDGVSQNEALDIEDYLICEHDTINSEHGYNLQRTRAIGYGKRIVTKESREKLRLANSGDKNSNFGKISITNGIKTKFIEKGELLPKDWYIGGLKHDEKEREKIRSNLPSQYGDKNPFYGKRHTKESIEKMSLSHKRMSDKTKQLIMLNTLEHSKPIVFNGIYYKSIREASRITGRFRDHIRKYGKLIEKP